MGLPVYAGSACPGAFGNALKKYKHSLCGLYAEGKLRVFNTLLLQNLYIAAYERIPLYENYRDPFDRILLATALSENIAIISADADFALYKPHIEIVSTV